MLTLSTSHSSRHRADLETLETGERLRQHYEALLQEEKAARVAVRQLSAKRKYLGELLKITRQVAGLDDGPTA